MNKMETGISYSVYVFPEGFRDPQNGILIKI